ncbi:MAG: 30S ribosomal protein S17 [Chloroflexi bacterium]|jgi:small subunit ribosomal protein S17|nr:30S ribosomal protein S17 [Chloroflexota bacterium]
MGNRRTLVGDVVSNKMEKTVVVIVRTRRQHLRYKKYIEYTKKFKAHDADNTCKVGDRVKLIETRPLSKEKRWRVAEVVTKV